MSSIVHLVEYRLVTSGVAVDEANKRACMQFIRPFHVSS